MSLKRVLYTLFLYLIFPFVILRLFWRSRSNPAYRHRILERLGFVRVNQKGSEKHNIIWVHAVSVGETIAAKPLIEALIDKYPDYRVLVTTTTPTGSDMVKQLFSTRVEHLYYPYDLPEIIFRFLNRTKPEILIVVETEIWPNLYAACKRRKIPIMMVNARLSQRSTDAYLKIRPLVAETLSQVNLIAVRSQADADRFKQLGAINKQIKVLGNIKFDIQLEKGQLERGKKRRKEWGAKRPVWVAASTHQGEDQEILNAYIHLLKLFPDLLLVIVPRHPERFEEVWQLCLALRKKGISSLRHSKTENYNAQDVQIILGDSMGEMQSWFACADIAFIGGSIVDVGGHNPLEATAQGVPVLSGKYMYNFEEISSELSKEELLFICDSPQEIEKKMESLLGLMALGRMDFSAKAKSIMQQHSGVTARLIQLISSFIKNKAN